MPYRKEIFQAPGIYEVKKYHTYRLGGGPNIQKTDEGLKKRNSRRAKTKLYRLIATNFKRDDLRIDLTYANPEPTAEEAKNRIRKFIRDLRKKYKKKNAELYRYLSLSFTALTVCAFYSSAARDVAEKDWSALMDTVPTISTALWVLVLISILINSVSLFKGNK